MTSPDVAALQADAVVVIPVGSVEQHSRHLPVGTDSLLAQAVCERLEQQSPDTVLLAPPMWYGASDHHLAFAGSSSVGSELLARTIAAVVESLHRSTGVRAFLVVNGHAGNEAALRLSVEQVARALPQVELAAVAYWRAAFERLAERGAEVPSGIGHADHVETSLVLSVDPSLVRTELAEADVALERSGWVVTTAPFDRRTRHGGMGDPTGADAAHGDRLLEAAVERLRELVEDLRRGGA